MSFYEPMSSKIKFSGAKKPKEEQSRIRKQCANRRLMADGARKPTRIGSIKDICL